MCRYLRIVFECGHGHNTASIVPCSGPQNCFNPELFQSQLWKEGSKNPSRFPASSMTELAFRGVLCEACLRSAREDMRSMRKKIGFLEQRVEALRQAREAASAYGGGRWEPERSGIPEARVKAPQQPEHAHHHHSEDVEKTKNKLTQDQKVERMLTKAKEANERHARSAHRTLGTLTRTHTLCASGRCSNQAVVMNDGRKGEFCRQHTCSARDWGCLEDVYHPEDGGSGGGRTRYCPAHTCCVTGCRGRVLGRGERFCRRHEHAENDARVLCVITGGHGASAPRLV